MVNGYDANDPRGWAREHLTGCSNVLIASYSADALSLNEAGIRHDVRRNIELGFTGPLLVAETAMDAAEYVRFAEIAVDEAAGRQQFVFHAAFDTLEANIDLGHRLADVGVDLALLSYPPSFYPQHDQDIYDYTRSFCDAVRMGVVVFPVPLWGFERIHPAALSPDLLARLVADVPNVVAIKAEGGVPSIGGFADAFVRLGDEVIVTMPLEFQGIPLKALVPVQWMGTSVFEYFGDAVPSMFSLLEAGETEKALDLFWQVHPARQAAWRVSETKGSNVVHRMVWKYMAWLNGYNGGPLRSPTMRIVGDQMAALRKGLEASGLPVTDDPDAAFFVGRNP